MQSQHGMQQPHSWVCADESVKAREETRFSKKKVGGSMTLIQMKNEHIIDFLLLINQRETQAHVNASSKGRKTHILMEQRN